jgi:hypothetical protein
MSEAAPKKTLSPYQVWGLLAVLTIIYGFVLAIIQHGGFGFEHVFRGLWTIITNPALLTHDYIAMAGIGPAFVNVGLSALLMLGAFKFAKLPGSGPQMGVFGLVMGFAFLGKNPVNMLPILLGALAYSAYMKKPGESLRETYKGHVTFAGFATCLAPVISQPSHFMESPALGWVVGVALGLIIGFVINAMAVFIRKSHEGLNLYNIGWGAGLIAIGLTMIYSIVGVTPFGPGVDPGYTIGMVGYSQAIDVYGNPIYISGMGAYNLHLFGYLAGVTLFFLIIALLSGAKLSGLKESLYLKAGDSKFINNMYAKYGAGPVYLAMFLLGVLALILTLGFGLVTDGGFGIYMNGPILGAILSMIGWGGFGKAVANAFAIILGVIVGGVIRFFAVPGFAFENAAGQSMGILQYFSTQTVIWTSAFWGTCLSPMARFFGFKWAIPIGIMHFAFAATIAPFHWGQNLYNNGLAAGFVCVVMIPIIRALDKKGKYAMEKVYPDPQ